jgi:hypothetical protein
VDAQTFASELELLLREFDTRQDNPASVELHGCKNCVECTFCKNSKALLRCHYCVDSERCVQSTHCRASRDLYAANHCIACERCSHSSYLVRCSDCTSCTYCFGCVGLVGKDFHILNRPYPRSEYFAITAKLKTSLRLS